MKVSYEIYVLPGETPDLVVEAEDHKDDSFVQFTNAVFHALASDDQPDDELARRAKVVISIDGTPELSFGPRWFDGASIHALQSGLTFKHQQLAGKQGREGTTNVQEMKDHGVL